MKDEIKHGRATLLRSRVLIFFILLPSAFLISSGCAIAPRGPVVSHEVKCYEGRRDGLIRSEKWQDTAGLRAFYLFTDPSGQNIVAWHTNQAALGGCSHFSAGSASITVDTNTAAIIGAGGTAAGNIIGAAAKTAVK